MTPAQQQAFADAAGFSASSLSFEIKLLVGSLAVLGAVLILAGLMQLLNSNQTFDKVIFIASLFAVSFILMLIFAYLA